MCNIPTQQLQGRVATELRTAAAVVDQDFARGLYSFMAVVVAVLVGVVVMATGCYQATLHLISPTLFLSRALT